MLPLRAGLGLLVFLAFCLPSGGAQAPAAPAACTGASPPCGYIMPIMDTTLEGKERCGSPYGGDPTGCPPIMAKGESMAYAGTLVWHWDVTQDGIYPPSTDQPILITFDGTSMNPGWLEFAVEPEQFTIAAQDFADPANYRTDDTDPLDPRIEFYYERPVEVTITRTGDPDEDDLRTLENRGGLVQFGVKARSSESGTYYKRSFTLEEFRYDGRSLIAGGDGDKESPGIGPVASLAVVGMASLAFRRRLVAPAS